MAREGSAGVEHVYALHEDTAGGACQRGRNSKSTNGTSRGQHFEWVSEEPIVSDVDFSFNQMSLHFVAESGITRPQGTVRNLIRSQARRKVQRTREKPGKDVQKVSRSVRIRLPDPHGARGNHVLDPFSPLPSVAPAEFHVVQELLQHYDTVFRHTYAPVNPRDKFLSWAISDSTLLQSTLFISAMSMDCLHGRPFSPVVFHHQGKTIRLLNKRLEDSVGPPPDEVIVTVTNLTHLEALGASPERAKVHMDGLEAMIKSRGGLQNMKNGIAKGLATWLDSCVSILLGTKPRFDIDTIEKPVHPLNCGPFGTLALRYKSKLSHLTGLPELSTETIEVYWELQHLSKVKDEVCYQRTETTDIDSYSDTLEYLERQIVALMQSEHLALPKQETSILHLFSNAAILHIYIFMRDLPRGLPFRYLIADRIRLELEELDIQALLTPYPEMLLWILIMGGIGAIGAPTKTWFANIFADSCRTLGLRGGDEIALTLKEFFWSEQYRSPVTAPFWNDVAKAQGVGGYEVRRLTDHVAAQTFNAPSDLSG